MKILHVINSCSIANGAAKLLLDVIAQQKTSGHLVDVISLVETTPSYTSDFIRAGVNHFISILPVGGSMKNPLLIIKLRNLIRKYDIVHTHLFPTFYWVALTKIIFNINGIRLVCTEHTSENNRRKCWMRPIEQYIYKQYNHIIAISDAVKSNLIKHLKFTPNITTINNGINVNIYNNATPSSRKDLNIPDDVILLTQVAAFRPEKDQLTVLKTLALLPHNYHVLFIGGGVLLTKHLKIAQQLDVSDRVHFVGVRKDVPSLLKMSDIIIMSSHFEGFGLAAVEGMASHKPVIASNVAGLSDVVKDAGLLFPPYDIEHLKKHIEELSMNLSYYTQTADKCYERALQYDISKTVQQYEMVYKTIL